jgi:hypothetical protein
MRHENSPIDSDRSDDCIGKQHIVRMQVVATAGAPHAAWPAATPSTAADPGTGEIAGEQLSRIIQERRSKNGWR